MKQIHIRRFLSLLLAALTLWAAAVTAGSDSAAAALQQLRQAGVYRVIAQGGKALL